MTHKLYTAPQNSLWQGRTDSTNDDSHFRWHQVINCMSLNELPETTQPSFCLLGFACDEGVKRNQGRPGAKEGPQALRKALASLPYHHSCSLYDVGTINCLESDLETAQEKLTESVQTILTKGHTPFVMGGGHEVAFGHGQAIYNHFQDKKVGIINFDAHYDLRPLTNGQGSSGTPFLQLAEQCKKQNRDFHYLCIGIQESANTKALFNTANELGVETILKSDLGMGNLKNAENKIQNFCQGVDVIYLTICLDAFAAAFAPGVSAPQPNGLFPQTVLHLLQIIKNTQKTMSYDIAELSPALDRDQQTTKLAAHIVFSLLAQ